MNKVHHDEMDVPDGASSSLKHLKELHVRKPRVDLRAAREKAAEDRPIEHLRVENNAILSIFIEDIWKRVHEYTHKHRFGIVEPRTALDIADGDRPLLVPITEADLERRCEAAGDYSSVVRQLDECTKPVVFAMIKDWRERRFERLEKRDVDERDSSDRVFIRFLKVQDEINSDPLDELSADTWTAQDLVELRKTLQRSLIFGSVAKGFVTAREIILGALAVAPKVYQQQFGEPIGSAKMSEIIGNLKPLVLMLAADDIESHVSIAIFLMLGEPTEKLRSMDPRMFFLSKPRGKLTLEINEEILRAAAFSQNMDEPRTGCPALESIGSSGKNVVTELYEWYMDLARRFYLPQIERLGNQLA